MLPTNLPLDPDLNVRLQKLAAARGQSSDVLLREALNQFFEREEKSQNLAGDPQHPSRQPWPRRSPVGGIITPV